MSNVKLVAGKVLSLSTDGLTTGSYNRLADVDYSHGDYPTSIAVSATATIGPFVTDSHWFVSDGVSWSIDNPDLGTQEELNLFNPITVTSNVGAASTGVTAVERGYSNYHTTTLTVASALPAIAGGANLAVGKLLYTFPAGAIIVHSAYMSMAITQTEANITADTPDGGLGTTIGSGVVAVLGGTAAFENILTGQTFNDCDGTAEVKTVADQVLVIEAAGDHTVYFNVADGWAADGDAAAAIAGTVVINWSFVA